MSLLTCFAGYSQSSIEIRDNDSFGIKWSKYRLYRNDTLIFTVKQNLNQKLFEDLPFGNYRVEHKSIQGKDTSVKIGLSEKRKYDVVI